MKRVVGTFTSTIYVGLREAENNFVHSIEEVHSICQKYVDEIGLCVTVTQTEFIYTGGSEPGASIGFINYPRFPDNPECILQKTLELAGLLLNTLNQQKISIVCPDKTYMIERERKI